MVTCNVGGLRAVDKQAQMLEIRVTIFFLVIGWGRQLSPDRGSEVDGSAEGRYAPESSHCRDEPSSWYEGDIGIKFAIARCTARVIFI